MKNLLFPFILLLGIFTANAQTNLLPADGNYSFDNGTASNAYWWYLNGSPTYANFAWQTAEKHSGAAAYQLNVTTSGTQQYHVQVVSSQNSAATYPVIASGTPYTLRFWMKTANGGGVVRISNVGSAPYSADVAITQGGWTLYSFPITGNGTTFRPSIDIGLANVGTYYIDDVALYLTSSLGVNDINPSKSGTAIYPNPARESINLSNTFFSDAKTVKVYDMNGRSVLTAGSAKSIDVSTLPKGNYIIKTDTGKSFKFIKN